MSKSGSPRAFPSGRFGQVLVHPDSFGAVVWMVIGVVPNASDRLRAVALRPGYSSIKAGDVHGINKTFPWAILDE